MTRWHDEDRQALAGRAVVEQAGRTFLPEHWDLAWMTPVDMAPVAGEAIQECGQAPGGFSADSGGDFLRFYPCQLDGEVVRFFP